MISTQFSYDELESEEVPTSTTLNIFYNIKIYITKKTCPQIFNNIDVEN